jgi:mono/diheme cytochrome c family protein
MATAVPVHARLVAPVLLALALSAVSCGSNEGAGGGGSPAIADTVATAERGAYLVTIAGCNDCHTPGGIYGKPDFQRTLSGSELGWTGPWGTSYARNLTPDPETGLGNWSEDDIAHALQTGKRADGTDLLPPMPWPNFAVFTPRDVKSVAMYLKSLPPVHHVVPTALPPGAKAPVALVFPPPTAWDAPKTP